MHRWKYCLSYCGCFTASSVADTDVFQEAKHSEAEDLQIALQTKNSEALEGYLQKYPESAKRNEVSRTIAGLKRSEFTEWTLFPVFSHHFPAYLKISSIEQIGDRVAVRTKIFVAPKTPITETYPDAEYSEDSGVFDCRQPISALAETTIVSKTGQTIFHYKWADPQLLDLTFGSEVELGTVNYTLRNMICHEEIANAAFREEGSQYQEFHVSL